jgi:hypothetical protein
MSVYALHILYNRRECCPLHSTVESIKPCEQSRKLYSANTPKESSQSGTNSSRSQPIQPPGTFNKTYTRGTYTNRTRHSAKLQTYTPLGVYKNPTSVGEPQFAASLLLRRVTNKDPRNLYRLGH